MWVGGLLEVFRIFLEEDFFLPICISRCHGKKRNGREDDDDEPGSCCVLKREKKVAF